MRMLSRSASCLVTLLAKCRLKNSWPTTEQGPSGTVYFSGLPPSHPTRPRPAADHLQTPPRTSADRLSPRLGSLREQSDGSMSPCKRAGDHVSVSASDPLALGSSPLGLSHRLRASISAAQQVHAGLMRPLRQEEEVQSADHNLGKNSANGRATRAESMRAGVGLQAPAISGSLPTESDPAIANPVHSNAVPASDADEWHSTEPQSTQSRVTVTVGAAKLPSPLLQAWMTEGSCKMRVMINVCSEESETNHTGAAITVESCQPYFGHTFPLHLSAQMHKVNACVCASVLHAQAC
jgi:hypothetical protein